MGRVNHIRKLPSPTTKRHAGLLLPTTAIFLAVGCASTEVKKDPAPPPPPAPTAPVIEASSSALCAMQLRVDDARARGTIDAVRDSLVKEAEAAPDDRVLVYGVARAIENDQARWKAYKALAERAPGSAVAALGSCEIYAMWKMDDQIDAPCAEAEAGLPGLALADVARATLLLRRANTTAALAAAEAAVAADASCAPAHVAVARVKTVANDADGAIAAWDAALQAAPTCFSCALERAQLIEATQGAKSAIPAWESALAMEPTHAVVLERFAAALVGEDDARALEAYENAIKSGRATTTTLLAAATLADRTGDLVKAADYAEKAVAMEPTLVDGWRLVLSVADRRNEEDGRERAAIAILRLLPEDASSHLVLARLARANENIIGALTHYDAIAVRGPGDSLDEAAMKVALEERDALRLELAISSTPLTGDANSVVNQVQKITRTVYEKRLKQKRSLKGSLEVVLRTRGDGAVEDVALTDDKLSDPFVAASVIGNFKNARIIGKAQRLTIKLTFE
jgi:tetratricopeptide (TPR) repeat protein